MDTPLENGKGGFFLEKIVISQYGRTIAELEVIDFLYKILDALFLYLVILYL